MVDYGKTGKMMRKVKFLIKKRGQEKPLGVEPGREPVESSRNADEKRERNDFSGKLLKRVIAEDLDTSKKFYPHGCVDELMPVDTVVRLLSFSRTTDEKMSKLVRFVTDDQKPAKLIFAIAILSGFQGEELSDLLTRFMEAEFRDSSLPITALNRHRVPFFHHEDADWIGVNCGSFEQLQWQFLAPVFTNEGSKVVLPPQNPLPFTNVIRRVGSGGFGVVHKATVHEAHRKHTAFENADNSGDVALKEVNEPGLLPEDSERPAEGGVQQESEANEDLRELKHPHLIEFIMTIHRGEDQRYLMFRWANGQDLGKYWAQTRNPKLSPAFVKEVITQVHGLTDGLKHLHTCDKGNYRHTDIKPANILRFVDNIEERRHAIGTWKISDMGLAKKHTIRTSLRKGTAARAATTRYQPPEVGFELTDEGIGRRFDIWSLGCVLLELVIWLLHGSDTLDEFNDKWLGKQPNNRDSNPFYERQPRNFIEVHPVVSAVINSLLEDHECQGKTAIGDLLRLIKTKMLVVGTQKKSAEAKRQSQASISPSLQLPSQHAFKTASTNIRAYSEEVLQDLDDILYTERHESYWFTGRSRANLAPLQDPRPKQYGDHETKTVRGPGSPIIQITGAEDDDNGLISPESSLAARSHDQTHLLNDRWDFPVDNKFAANVLQDQDTGLLFPSGSETLQLCGTCKALNFTAPFFSISDDWSDLESSRKTCVFCNMRWDLCQTVDRTITPTLRFEREGSVLKLNGSYPPRYVNPAVRAAQSSPDDYRIQIGFPRLPTSSSNLSFHIIRQWLQDCDDNHPQCRPLHKLGLPTRLVDVGFSQGDSVRVYETQPGDTMQYIALSHPWGKPPHFRSLVSNIEQFKKNIDFHELPATFQDAVVVTRQLGQRYIWIDSLCIIQGQGGDFDQESAKMETVFSSAYYVLAASSATQQRDGFLKRNRDREFLTFAREGASPLYICRFTDDFGRDVLDSYLSHRGWVFQERALARRTVYFTRTQIYWECGDGVRCQSLAKMTNTLASFLGDPNFPSKLSDGSSRRGEKILFYEDLYRQYSRLDFTRETDRAVAILGIEERLIRDLGARGGFGVFDDGRSLLQHGLLWKRGKEFDTLTKVGYDPNRIVPSWSWMAYKEGIDFLDLPLGDVKWLPHEIISPWADLPTNGSTVKGSTDAARRMREISIRAREFQAKGEVKNGDERSIFYDSPDPNAPDNEDLRCVLMGRIKNTSKLDKELIHCVLFVRPQARLTQSGTEIYERVGVGFLSGKFIDLDSPGALVRLQ
ncbi:hypothetical protein S7711_09576 [Stachybotrys chartarum IBT 7711]|uniref:Protein kinase domain-containing protein n=1 Tax=Stachybotrys chartarum (strain CBS 109288 / IBT 7711) TaxID=1280523 RepID=A0A084AUU4_STACB|nr:hypothetical protein S7711_09576 [Stachybotrys chartarum IBT 7711]